MTHQKKIFVAWTLFKKNPSFFFLSCFFLSAKKNERFYTRPFNVVEFAATRSTSAWLLWRADICSANRVWRTAANLRSRPVASATNVGRVASCRFRAAEMNIGHLRELVITGNRTAGLVLQKRSERLFQTRKASLQWQTEQGFELNHSSVDIHEALPKTIPKTG